MTGHQRATFRLARRLVGSPPYFGSEVQTVHYSIRRLEASLVEMPVGTRVITQGYRRALDGPVITAKTRSRIATDRDARVRPLHGVGSAFSRIGIITKE